MTNCEKCGHGKDAHMTENEFDNSRLFTSCANIICNCMKVQEEI